MINYMPSRKVIIHLIIGGQIKRYYIKWVMVVSYGRKKKT